MGTRKFTVENPGLPHSRAPVTGETANCPVAATFSSTLAVTGAITATGGLSGDVSATDIDAGASGTAGSVDVFPSTASKGKFTLSCTDQDGDTAVTLKPAAMGQATAVSIPDPGAATANVLLTDAGNDGVVVTATAAELNYLDITTLGTGAASKAVVLDAGDDYTWPATGILTYGGSAVNATGDELAVCQMADKCTVFDDFIGTWTASETLNADMWSTTAGSGANTEAATTVANSINGEITLKSSTADGAQSANATGFYAANLPCKANQGGLVMEARVKIDDITEAYLFVGFTDALGSTVVEHPIDFTDGSDTMDAGGATDACGIVFSGDATTQEWCHGGEKAGTNTTAAFSGSAPVNATYVVLRVEVSATGGVRGFVNGTAIGAEVANAVTATTALTPAVIVSNTAAAQTIATVDYVWWQQDR